MELFVELLYVCNGQSCAFKYRSPQKRGSFFSTSSTQMWDLMHGVKKSSFHSISFPFIPPPLTLNLSSPPKPNYPNPPNTHSNIVDSTDASLYARNFCFSIQYQSLAVWSKSRIYTKSTNCVNSKGETKNIKSDPFEEQFPTSNGAEGFLHSLLAHWSDKCKCWKRTLFFPPFIRSKSSFPRESIISKQKKGKK